MSIGLLAKPQATRVIGIDCSTRSLAFAIFEGETPIKAGEIKFEGATVFERLRSAKNIVRALVNAGEFKADYIAIESAIMVKSVQVAIDLAYVYGAVISELMECSPKVEKIAPISWQTGIGNPNLKKEEKDKLRRDNPGRKESWYQNEGRKIRKQRTLAIARKYFNIPGDSDNVGDAVGLAVHCVKHLTRPVSE